ncbi:hypothetical protein OF001_U250001 [Pseudomonas sp. OF001]|nr:hypothetical protein OF001_U250001 [Pseudomonas sp. OF001]
MPRSPLNQTLEAMRFSPRSAITTGLIFLPSLVAFWYFLGQAFAPDACLDHGGSFDYSAWQCSYTENHPYIATPFYSLLSFWVFWGCVIASSVAAHFYRRRGNAF